MLLTVAGLASGFCSFWGWFAWVWCGMPGLHKALLMLFCVLPGMSLVAFGVYFVRRGMGLGMAWLILMGDFVTTYLMGMQQCLRHSCTTADSLKVGWGVLIESRLLWILALAALCLLLDYTAATPVAPVIRDPE